MKKIFLSSLPLFFTMLCAAQITVSNINAQSEENNVLRYDISFDTNEDSYSFLKYYRALTDSLGNALDTVWVNSEMIGPTMNHSFHIVEMVAENTYGFQINAFNTGSCVQTDYETFDTAPLPDVVPVMDTTLFYNEEADLTGYYLTNTVLVPDKTVQIFNRKGEVVWYDYHSGEPNVGNSQTCQAYSITEEENIILLECHEITVRDYHSNILDYVDLNGTPYDSLLFHHDAIINDAGNFVVIAAAARQIPSGDSSLTVMEENLLEITPLGEVIWSWNSFDYFDPTGATNQNGFFFSTYGAASINWLHLNALEQDNDGNYILSFKEINQLVKINSETGAIIWKLGGSDGDISFFPNDQFGDQHDINRTAVGTYMVFDNTGLDSLSRLLEFSLDFYDDPVAINQWEYVIPQELQSVILGTARRLPNDNRYGCAGNQGTIIEVSAAGEVQWQMRQSAWVYRTFFLEAPFPIAAGIADITMGDNPDLLCETEAAFALNAEPVGGYWSGEGVENGMFDPASAALGTHTLSYKWGWNTATIEIEVSDQVPPCIVSVDELGEQNTIRLYPNPVANELTVLLNEQVSGKVVIQIIDVTGKVIRTQEVNAAVQTVKMDVTELANGMYTLTVQGENQNASKHFVISK
ncbi:MAG: arylsulfate sulfotransferase [Litorivivens sp.]|jgi:arylsulfate sulfotransferase